MHETRDANYRSGEADERGGPIARNAQSASLRKNGPAVLKNGSRGEYILAEGGLYFLRHEFIVAGIRFHSTGCMYIVRKCGIVSALIIIIFIRRRGNLIELFCERKSAVDCMANFFLND